MKYGRMNEPKGRLMNVNIPDDLLDQLADRIAERIELPAPAAPSKSPWLSADGAAEYLACKKPRIYDLVNQGRVPVHREGNRLMFLRSELDEWILNGAAAGV